MAQRWQQIGREGGRVSGMVKRDRIFKKYMDIVKEKGVYEALRVCRNDSWHNGYTTAYHTVKRELKNGLASDVAGSSE
jgi:hypothetical protein